MIGQTISHYKILEKLGEGGMGVVYKAEDTKLKRTVALKFLPPEMTRDKEAKKRFIHEAQAASSLEHNNICNIHEIDETDDGQTFIVMACYDGETLKDKIHYKGKETSPLRIKEAIGIAMQIAQGLKKAHDKGIVHRDIKPGNVFVTEDGVVKIVDFGLAKLTGRTKLTKTGTTLGTVSYMSPEQTRGEKVDHRTDVWSLGVVLYEMIAGQLPFKGDYEQAVSYSIVNEEPEPLTGVRTGVPLELERIVNKALYKNPEERYQHVGDILVDLKSLRKMLESEVTKAERSRARFPEKKQSYLYGGIGILLILISIVGYYLFLGHPKIIDSIAVLPFSNTAADPDLEYLSDGMTESIIGSLSKLPSLKRVIARSSVFHYKGKEIVPTEVGKELGVEALLISRISQREDELSISVELVNAAENSRIWGNQYKRSVNEIFDIQDEISKAIAENLRLKLSGEDFKRMTKRYTENSEAYRLYLKGKFFNNKHTEEALYKSIEFFQKAIQEDPEFALAYVGISDTYKSLGWFNFMPRNTAYERGTTAAVKALEIDNMIGDAYAALATHKRWYEWEPEGAEEAYRKALSLNPLDAETYHEFAHLLEESGKFEESIQMMNRALEQEPLSIVITSCLGQVFFNARQYDEAIEQLQKAIEMDSTYHHPYCWLGMTYTQKGMYAQAVDMFYKGATSRRFRTRMIGALGYTLAIQGKQNEAIGQIERLNDLSKEMVVDPCFIAWIYAGLGETDRAFEWLEKAYEERSNWMVMIKVDPFFDSLRSDERFINLIRRLGLE